MVGSLLEIVRNYELQSHFDQEALRSELESATRNNETLLNAPGSYAEYIAWALAHEFPRRENPWHPRFDVVFLASIGARQFDQATIAAWRTRWDESQHAKIKLRYGSLILDHFENVTGSKPPHDFVNQYCDFVLLLVAEIGGNEPSFCVGILYRALNIALTFRRREKAATLLQVLFHLEKQQAEKGAIPWGFSLELATIPQYRRLMSESERQQVLATYDDRVRKALLTGGLTQPSFFKETLTQITNVYRGEGGTENIQKARELVELYGDAVGVWASQQKGMMASTIIEETLVLLEEYGLDDAAGRLMSPLQSAYLRSREDFHVHRQEFSVSAEEYEGMKDSLGSTLSEGIRGLAAGFLLPPYDSFVKQVRKKGRSLLSLINMSYSDHSGRTTARPGRDSEPESIDAFMYVIHHIRFSGPFLDLALSAMREKFAPTSDEITSVLMESPVFDDGVFPILRSGVEAYLRDDHIAAIHILTPQVERAVRFCAMDCGVKYLTTRSNQGGLNYVSLDDLLRHPRICQVLTERVSFHLRMLFSDQRGDNIRNEVAHAAWTADYFNRIMANKVLHGLFVFCLFEAKVAEAVKAS